MFAFRPTVRIVLFTAFLAPGLINCALFGWGDDGGPADRGDQSSSPPAAPTGVAVIAGDAEVTISWNHVDEAESYNLYWGTAAGVTIGSGTPVASATSPYAQSGLSNGTTYYYVVTALNEAGESEESAEVSATPADTTAPPAVTDFAATAGDMRVELSWVNPGDSEFAGTLILRRSDGIFPTDPADPNAVVVYHGTAQAHTDTGVTNGTEYLYAAFAYDEAMNYSAAVHLNSTPSLFKDHPELLVSNPIDPSTVTDKVLFGYQGWFTAPGDGSGLGWTHWSYGAPPNADSVNFDHWPDLREFDEDELFGTEFSYPDGSPAKLYSAQVRKSVTRHFKWMWEYDLDGVLLQRFVVELPLPLHKQARDRVLDNVRIGSEMYGRGFAVMYDITASDPQTFVELIVNDWAYLVNTARITASPYYLHHDGKPVVGIWGLGFTSRPDNKDQGLSLLAHFQSAAPQPEQAFVIGGVPFYWRTGTVDSRAGYLDLYTSLDAIEPWAVGRYASEAAFDTLYDSVIAGDLAFIQAWNSTNPDHQLRYVPIIWPGFSWKNQMHLRGQTAPLNQIPRNGGELYWRQIYRHVGNGPLFYRVAMFDEVDEGTAIFKVAPNAASLPTQGEFLHLSVDGAQLPSDWYLRLSREFTLRVRGWPMPIGPEIPIQP